MANQQYHNVIVDNFEDSEEQDDKEYKSRNDLNNPKGNLIETNKNEGNKKGSVQHTLSDTPNRKDTKIGLGNSVHLAKGKLGIYDWWVI